MKESYFHDKIRSVQPVRECKLNYAGHTDNIVVMPTDYCTLETKEYLKSQPNTKFIQTIYQCRMHLC